MVKASASRATDPRLDSRLRCRDFTRSCHTSDLKIDTPVATLPGAWRYRVSAGTGRPGVSILWPGEMESLICNFCLSVAARKIVWADPSLRYTRMLLGRQASNKENKPCIKYFGLPISASCPVYRNVNGQEYLLLASVSIGGCTSLFLSLKWRSRKPKRREKFPP